MPEGAHHNDCEFLRISLLLIIALKFSALRLTIWFCYWMSKLNLKHTIISQISFLKIFWHSSFTLTFKINIIFGVLRMYLLRPLFPAQRYAHTFWEYLDCINEYIIMGQEKAWLGLNVKESTVDSGLKTMDIIKSKGGWAMFTQSFWSREQRKSTLLVQGKIVCCSELLILATEQN